MSEGKSEGKQEQEQQVIKRSGQCYCGAVRFAVDGTVLFRCYCHCTICQRKSGAPCVALLGVTPASALKVVQGEDKLTADATTEFVTRYRCQVCGSPVMNHVNYPGAAFRDCPITLLDRDADGQLADVDEIRPTAHIHYANRLSDIFDNDGLVKFPGDPVPE